MNSILHITTRRAYRLGARVALRRPSQNRLKLGAHGEGIVSDDLRESRRLPRTDG